MHNHRGTPLTPALSPYERGEGDKGARSSSLGQVAMLVALSLFALPITGSLAAEKFQTPENRPNVLFIAIDDLRDWVGYLGANGQVKTPNLDRLAAQGLSFSRSYCAAPVCNASRAALLSGLRPSTSGVYENNVDWRLQVKDDQPTLPQFFKQNGYHVVGAGKIYHGGMNRDSDWDVYLNEKGGGDEKGASRASGGKNGGAASDAKDDGVGGIRFKPLDCDDADMVDYRTVSYVLKKLAQTNDKPFFIACGLHKPHMGWDVPKKYYEMYPLDKIELPKVKTDDLADVPPAGVKMAKPEGDHAEMVKSGRWKEAVQGYLATITFADAMIGRLMDGFAKLPCASNTIVVLWSDHGWHLGEKEHWRKFALWENATRSPLIWSVPGMTKPGSICERPVDFMHIYPTLTDLCGLPTPKHVEGPSIRALLADPKAAWSKPALTTYLPNNHAVRTERWRYIRYADGGEELYDETKDPHEWTNLAGDQKYAELKTELAKSFPAVNAPWPGRNSGEKKTKK